MRVVLANGCFDLLHYGHLKHLYAARRMGTRLVVGLTMDAYVNKGPGRPVFTQWQRAEMLMALRCVDEVFFCQDALDALTYKKPDVFVKGSEYKGKIRKEDYDYCKANNITIAFTDEPTYSSTQLLRHG